MTTPNTELMTKLESAVTELKQVQNQAITRQDGVITEALKASAEKLTQVQAEIQTLEQKHSAAMRVIDTLEAEKAVKGDKKTGLLGTLKSMTPWDAERKQAFDTLLRKGDRTDAAKMLAEVERKDITIGNDAEGGFLLPPEMANFISTILFETSPIREVARVVNTSRDAIEVLLRDQRFGAGIATETGVNSKTDTAKFGKVTIQTYPYEARPLVSQFMVEDADFDVAAFVGEEVADEISRQENADFVSGSGNNEPQGLLTPAGWTTNGTYERNKLENRKSGSNGVTTADGFIRTMGDLKEGYQPNASWLMHRLTYVGALTLKDSQNRYLIGNDLNNVIDWANPTILGKRVRFCSDMPVVDNQTANNDAYAAMYGDFRRGYMIADRTGIRVVVDPYTQKPMVEYFTRKRTGGGIINFDCMKRLQAKA